MLVSDAVNAALERKGRSTVTNDYYAIRAVEDLPQETAPTDAPPEDVPQADETARDETAKK